MSQMTPREIVQELDKHIIGQDEAKRAVAIALRNRWRRVQVGEPLLTLVLGGDETKAEETLSLYPANEVGSSPARANASCAFSFQSGGPSGAS